MNSNIRNSIVIHVLFVLVLIELEHQPSGDSDWDSKKRSKSSFVTAPSMTIDSPAVSASGASDPRWAAQVNNFVRFSHVISIAYSHGVISLLS